MAREKESEGIISTQTGKKFMKHKQENGGAVAGWAEVMELKY